MAQTLRIVSGPSKCGDLMLGLFNNTMSKPQPVTFEYINSLGVAVKIEVSIFNIGRESGDGESWLFEGESVGTCCGVKGYFSTKRRTGWLEFRC